MALHALKKFGHLFMKESELRDVLLEIDEVRRDWSRLIKQQRNASQAIDKWCAHQSPHISEFMHGVMASEAEYNAAAYHFLEGQAKYQGCWSSILTERSELIEIKNQLKTAEKNARKAEKKLSNAQPDDLPKLTAQAEVARTELARIQGKFRDMSLFAQQGIETDLRNANYSRSEAHMKFLERAAFCEERILRLTHNLQRTESLNEHGGVTTQPFAAPPGPMKDPIWHHGEELNAMLNNDGRYASAMSMSQKRARETLLESDLNYIQEASSCFKGDFVDFFMVKCHLAQVAVQETPTVVLGKDEGAILEIVSRLSHTITLATFSGFGIVQILDAKERKIFWDHMRAVSDNAAVIFYRLVSGAETGITEVSIQPPCDKLNDSLSAIMTYVDSVCLTSGMRDELKRDSVAVDQSMQQALKAVQSLHDKVPRDNERTYDVNNRLLYSGEDVISQANTMVAEIMKFQTVIRESRVNITQEEYSVMRRDWDRLIDNLFTSLQTVGPVMSDSFRRVVSKGENYEELLIATRTLSTAPANLETFLQVTDFEDDDARDELVGIIQALEAKCSFLIAAVNESQTEYLSHAPVENFDKLSGEQAKSLLVAAQANILRIQNELAREQERIDRLTRVQKVSAFGVIPSDPVITIPQAPIEATSADDNISRPIMAQDSISQQPLLPQQTMSDNDNNNNFSSSMPQKDFSDASNVSLPHNTDRFDNANTIGGGIGGGIGGVNSGNSVSEQLYSNNNISSDDKFNSTGISDSQAPMRADISMPQKEYPWLNSSELLPSSADQRQDEGMPKDNFSLKPDVPSYGNDSLSAPFASSSSTSAGYVPPSSFPQDNSSSFNNNSFDNNSSSIKNNNIGGSSTTFSNPSDEKIAVPHNIWNPVEHSVPPHPVSSSSSSEAPVIAAPRDAMVRDKTSSTATDPILAPPGEYVGQRS